MSKSDLQPYYITLAIALIVFIYYKWNNDYLRIERYYFKEDKKRYYLLKASYFIVIVGIFVSIRCIVYEYAADLYKKLKIRLDKQK